MMTCSALSKAKRPGHRPCRGRPQRFEALIASHSGPNGIKKSTIKLEHQGNVSTLEEVFISKSSAQQRRGRAGRTAPGMCVRLFSMEDYEAGGQVNLAFKFKYKCYIQP